MDNLCESNRRWRHQVPVHLTNLKWMNSAEGLSALRTTTYLWIYSSARLLTPSCLSRQTPPRSFCHSVTSLLMPSLRVRRMNLNGARTACHTSLCVSQSPSKGPARHPLIVFNYHTDTAYHSWESAPCFTGYYLTPYSSTLLRVVCASPLSSYT